MIEINLLPEELRKREIAKLKLPEIPTLQKITYALLIFIGFQVLVSFFALYQRVEILGVRSQIASLKQENKEILRRKSETAVLNSRLRKIEFMTKRKLFWSSLLNSLSHAMSKSVWLRQFSILDLDLSGSGVFAGTQGESSAGSAAQKIRCLKLEGSAVGQGQETSYIGKFVKGLKESGSFAGFFAQIELSNINQRKIKDFDVYDFELVCVFRKELA